jgi:hypothetical protein
MAILLRKPASADRRFRDSDVVDGGLRLSKPYTKDGVICFHFGLGQQDGRRFSDLAVELDREDIEAALRALEGKK